MPQSQLVLTTDFGQGIVAVLIASVLLGFDRVYDRKHLGYWAATFLCLAAHVGGEMAHALLLAARGPGTAA